MAGVEVVGFTLAEAGIENRGVGLVPVDATVDLGLDVEALPVVFPIALIVVCPDVEELDGKKGFDSARAPGAPKAVIDSVAASNAAPKDIEDPCDPTMD